GDCLPIPCHYAPSLCLSYFNSTSTTELYTLSLHDALPISYGADGKAATPALAPAVSTALTSPIRGTSSRLLPAAGRSSDRGRGRDRKSTRLNSSHQIISYAVFCLKKKNNIGDQLNKQQTTQ